jgi:2-polyprenyl-6-methoxyphenol hydroxylase-like FAD-dependent oxidoreductase
MNDLPFLIAGGGIAGLSAALGLARAGFGARLFEQAPAFEEVGAGLQMSPNGVRALQHLGAWEAVEPSCVIPSEIHVRDGISGVILHRVRLGKTFEERYGAPYRVCHRADLLAGLVSAARQVPAIELHPGRRAVSARTDSTHFLAFADGSEVSGRAIVAADGIRSVLRQQICGTVAPVDRGHTIFRALLALKSLPPEIETDCVTIWLCPGAHVVHYPVSNWRNFNIVAAVESAGPDSGWGMRSESRDVAPLFSRTAEDLQGLVAAPSSWLRWQGADLPELPRWSNENTVLVGDAAHATLPFLAQGAVMALEDSCVLSRELASGSAAAAFRRYEAIRKPRTSLIQAQSRRQGQIYHASGAAAVARNVALRLAGSHIVRQQTEWIYDWKP